MNVSYSKTPKLYESAFACYEYLSTLDYDQYSYPAEQQSFHVFSDMKNAVQAFTIKSFLKTQNLEVCKLFVWSIKDLTDNVFVKPYLGHPNVVFKVYDPRIEYEGTPLAPQKRRFFGLRKDYMEKFLIPFDKDPRMWMNSGIFRFLIPYKYGGNYIDADVIFLRDFKPILNRNFAFCWDTSIDFEKSGKTFKTEFTESCRFLGPCAAILGFSGDREFCRICLAELIKIPPRLGTTCYDEELLSAVYRRHPGLFDVFPAGFFEMEWQLKTDMPQEEIDRRFMRNRFSSEVDEELFFENQFAWHYHNSHIDPGAIHPKSVMGRIMAKFD